MKKTFTTISIFLLFVIYALGQQSAIIIDYYENSKSEINVPQDKILVFKLPVKPSNGYIWQVVDINGEIFTADPQLHYTASNEGIGSEGFSELRFMAKKAGTSTIKLAYLRPWEKSKGMEEVSYTVTTEGAYSGNLKFNLENYQAPKLRKEDYEVKALPTTYSLLSLGYLTVVKNQGNCGSCWAFAGCGVFESAIKKGDGTTRDLSEQWMVNCGGSFGHNGCSGGYNPFDMYNNGAVYEQDCPYQGVNGSCGNYSKHEKIQSWSYISGSSSIPSTAAIKQAIYDHGALWVAVASSGMSNYTGGVWQGNGTTQCDHAVVLVGWDDNNQCWIMRNSWGTSWGENSGYMRIKYGANSIGYAASYLVYQGSADTQAPTTPTNLSASNITSSACSLSWTASTDNVGVDHYIVYKDGNSIGNPTTTSFNVTGLSASTTYSFTVKAFDAAGNASNLSTAKSVTTSSNGGDTEAPTAPSVLTSSNITSSSVSLSWNASTDNVGIDHYTVFKSTGSVGNTNSLSYNVTGLSASTTYSFTVKAYDAAGNESRESNTVTVTTKEGSGGEYCASNGNDFSYEWISKVELNGQSKSSNAAGYSDFTSTVINLVQGSNSIVLTPGFASSGYNEAWRIWIDLNDDKDFDDSGEQLFSQSGSAAISGTINIPTTATGQKRMRISMRYTTAPSTCGSFDYGEVEDYTVSFGGVPPSDTEAPTAPSSLNSSNLSSTGVSLSWNASTDNVGVHHYTVIRDGASISNPTTTSYTVNGLTPATTYSFTVIAVDAAGNESRASNAVTVTTLDDVTPPANYCASKGSNSSYFWIAKIGLGSMVKQSGNNNGYADFTSSIASVAKGSSQSLTVRAGYSLYTYTVYWAVWIDYNQNGTFESTELVVNGSTAQTTDASAAITIPTTALSGNTRMRVSMKYGSQATPCETFTFGEVEDYTVNISGSYGSGILSENSTANLGFVTESSVSLFPSPVKNTLNAEFSNVAPQSDIRIISATGAILRTIKASGNSMQIDVSKLSPGLYILQFNNGLEYKSERFIKE